MLISAEALKLAIRDDPEIDGRNYARMKMHINNAPTVDAVEVVHGRWVWKDFSGIGFLTLCCSECLESEGVNEEHKYCHNCGAKMDLEG